MEQRSYLKGRLAATTAGSRSRPAGCPGGRHACLAQTRPGMWDSARDGAVAAPIQSPAGWLEIHHGADEKHRFCPGALLLDLDLEAPWKGIARSTGPIMEPLADYERTGFFGKAVFTNRHLVDGDTVTLYYGGSDSVTCGARFSIQEILQTLHAP